MTAFKVNAMQKYFSVFNSNAFYLKFDGFKVLAHTYSVHSCSIHIII